MAKETKSATPAPGAPANAGAATLKERGERNLKDIFRSLKKDGKDVDPPTKMAPQAMVIINTIRTFGKNGITREELNKALKGVLVTRQPESRIVTYYQKSLVDSGAVELIREIPTPVAAAPVAKAA